MPITIFSVASISIAVIIFLGWFVVSKQWSNKKKLVVFLVAIFAIILLFGLFVLLTVAGGSWE